MVVDIDSDDECPELVETDEPSHIDAHGDKKVRKNSPNPHIFKLNYE